MTKAKIAITIPDYLLEEVRAAVARGEAPSVSAYITDAVAIRGGKSGLRVYLDAMFEEHGEPSPEEYAWADEQLRRMGLKPPKRAGSRSTRAR